ncbi:cupin domain-containing protein [Halosimplex litoreum]|uniref:Cupin domain-containing protein n=1 Tax=Halosimplex litoreum TaxID=1198301 RepID=A0A7T3KTV7_9EURY|nr:cupin domain-containing protein [Halosimplex litoreum]QPV61404.1 cupin domain-containing protein [Halosimplex litoreum]
MQVEAHSANETVEVVDGVHLTQLAVGDRMSMQHVHIEPGAVVPKHSHEHEQVGYITSGSGVFVVDSDASKTHRVNGEPVNGEEFPVSAGDAYHLGSEEPHSVAATGDEPLDGIDVFAPPRTNPDWME